jgi:hypothetical protein
LPGRSRFSRFRQEPVPLNQMGDDFPRRPLSLGNRHQPPPFRDPFQGLHKIVHLPEMDEHALIGHGHRLCQPSSLLLGDSHLAAHASTSTLRKGRAREETKPRVIAGGVPPWNRPKISLKRLQSMGSVSQTLSLMIWSTVTPSLSKMRRTLSRAFSNWDSTSSGKFPSGSFPTWPERTSRSAPRGTTVR